MIRQISDLDTYTVRQPVLRTGKNLNTCRFNGDDLETTKHFGYFIADNLVGVASIFCDDNKNFQDFKQMQLRGMAIFENYQKQGLGQKLLLHCEVYAKQNKFEIIWFNARKKAIPFYEKLGYSEFGSLFEIHEIGEHIVMYKRFIG